MRTIPFMPRQMRPSRVLLLAALLTTLTLIAAPIGPVSGAAAVSPKDNAMLAVIGNDGNVLVYDADGKNPISVTRDAVPAVRVYQWPTWSGDGRLAFFGASSDPADLFSLRVFIAESIQRDQPVTIRTAYTSPVDTFTYAAWSPAACAPGEDCRQLALLFTPPDPNGFGLRLIDDRAGQFSDKVIGQASPFFFDFAPDGRHMAWHQGGAQVGVYDVRRGGDPLLLADAPGKFQVPMWSPTSDNRLLIGVESPKNADLTDLVAAAAGDPAERKVLAAGLDSPLTFAWSPDGRYVAYVAGFDRVMVVDGKTAHAVRNGTSSDVVAFFWAPQSDRIAYLVVNRDTGGNQARLRSNGHTPVDQAIGGLTWHILDLASGTDSSLVSFNPSPDMIYLLNFFDQFARSHQVWSPDGHYLAYSVMDVLGKTSVQLIDTRQPDQPPIRVGGGTLAVWGGTP